MKLIACMTLMFFTCVTNLFASDMVDKHDQKASSYEFSLTENKDYLTMIQPKTPKELKKILKKAVKNQNVSDIAFVYVVAKQFKHCSVAPTAGGSSLVGAGILLSPVTFGISMLLLIPGVPMCAGGSFYVHYYKKLANLAKLELAAHVQPAVLKAIRSVKRKDSALETVEKLKEILDKYGFDTSVMVQS
jgi:hypothetical protein